MLTDSHSRKFSYLRLSVTDVCNFSCRYCLPNGYQKPEPTAAAELSLQEIRYLLKGFASAGFTKVRFTGGEPTVRRDLFSIIEFASSLPEFQKRALSTNGWNLDGIAIDLHKSGITNLNVSVDSLDSKRFHQLTGRDHLKNLLSGIDLALSLPFRSVKLNAVLHREGAMTELNRFLEYVRNRPVSVRFIELMKTHDRAEYQSQNYISAGEIQLKLLREGWTRLQRESDAGPAVEFMHPDYQGKIGLIAPYADGFCETCNRLRVTSRGLLRLCLFGEGGHSLRDCLQSDELAAELPKKLAELLGMKEKSHFLGEGRVGDVSNFSKIGG